MTIRIVRLTNRDVLHPVFTYDGRHLRWWSQGDPLTHLEWVGRIPVATGEIVFFDGAGAAGPLGRLSLAELASPGGGNGNGHGHDPLSRASWLHVLGQAIPSERISRIEIPPGGVLHGYQRLSLGQAPAG